MGPSQLGAEKQEECRPCVDKDVRHGRWSEGPPGSSSSDVVKERYEEAPHSTVSKSKKSGNDPGVHLRRIGRINYGTSLELEKHIHSPQKEATT